MFLKSFLLFCFYLDVPWLAHKKKKNKLAISFHLILSSFVFLCVFMGVRKPGNIKVKQNSTKAFKNIPPNLTYMNYQSFFEGIKEKKRSKSKDVCIFMGIISICFISSNSPEKCGAYIIQIYYKSITD